MTSDDNARDKKASYNTVCSAINKQSSNSVNITSVAVNKNHK